MVFRTWRQYCWSPWPRPLLESFQFPPQFLEYTLAWGQRHYPVIKDPCHKISYPLFLSSLKQLTSGPMFYKLQRGILRWICVFIDSANFLLVKYIRKKMNEWMNEKQVILSYSERKCLVNLKQRITHQHNISKLGLNLHNHMLLKLFFYIWPIPFCILTCPVACTPGCVMSFR